MIYESKILNVTLRRAKIHFVPDVVYAQVPTFERQNQLLQMDLLIPQIEKKLPAVTKFPQPIEDVKSAIRFLKANAQKFNVDAEKRIGALSRSKCESRRRLLVAGGDF